jgi:hypothetical protein
MKKIILINRYNTKKVDQEFMDLEMARFDQEREEEIEWEREELTRRILKMKMENGLLTQDDIIIRDRIARKHHAKMSKRMLERKRYQILKKEKPPKPRKRKKK